MTLPHVCVHAPALREGHEATVALHPFRLEVDRVHVSLQVEIGAVRFAAYSAS